jgi:pyrroline-5-carboxylate reductase
MDCPKKSLRITVLGCGMLNLVVNHMILKCIQCTNKYIGFMGTAILIGLLNKISSTDEPKITCVACVQSSASLDRLKGLLKHHETRVACMRGDYVKASEQADIVILGVPPGELEALLATDGLAEILMGKTIISLLAGISCTQIMAALTSSKKMDEGKQYHVLRVIPTMGATTNKSVSLMATTPHAGEFHQGLCKWLFQNIGEVIDLPENLMNEATAVGAACHALVIIAMDAIVDGSVSAGLPRGIALSLAARSLSTCAGLVAGGSSPETLKEAMSVPSGITINAIVQLERGHVRSAISEGVIHAIRYTQNMSS